MSKMRLYKIKKNFKNFHPRKTYEAHLPLEHAIFDTPHTETLF